MRGAGVSPVVLILAGGTPAPQRNATEGVPYSAAGGFGQEHVQRLAGYLRLQTPPGRIERGLGERVALEVGQLLLQFVAAIDRLPDERRREPFFADRKHAAAPLGAVARSCQRRAFAPAANRAAGHPTEHAMHGGIFAVGSPPRIDQRHGNVEQLDAVNVHDVRLGTVRAACDHHLCGRPSRFPAVVSACREPRENVKILQTTCDAPIGRHDSRWGV
jgi:hypothetical protein